jgi:hypothetical protein
MIMVDSPIQEFHRLCQNERMNRTTAVLILFCAAILEAGGDEDPSAKVPLSLR